MRHILLVLMVGAVLLFGTQLAFAHGGIVGLPVGQTVSAGHGNASGDVQEGQ
ncbi:MAG TPA: hypothetical protein VEZ44_14660 [bacterium]|nr:hypothetical protein [bacterium]